MYIYEYIEREREKKMYIYEYTEREREKEMYIYEHIERERAGEKEREYISSLLLFSSF